MRYQLIKIMTAFKLSVEAWKLIQTKNLQPIKPKQIIIAVPTPLFLWKTSDDGISYFQAPLEVSKTGSHRLMPFKVSKQVNEVAYQIDLLTGSKNTLCFM